MLERRAVLRRTAFDDVGDVNVFPLKVDRGKHLIQKLPCRTHKGSAGKILVPPRPLAHKHELGVRVAFPRHDGMALFAEFAFFAMLQFLIQRIPIGVHDQTIPSKKASMS